jgi:hypothetical protein
MRTQLAVGAITTALSLLAALTGVGNAQESAVKLSTDLPKPMFVGTPKDIRTPNLEPPRKGERAPFMVPDGTVNLALNKPVTSSDSAPIIGELAQITDGDKEAADGSYVELAPGKQYVQIDLEQESVIHAVMVWHYHKEARVYRDVVVRLSDDEDFITNVRTVFNNDHDNSSGLGIGKDREYIETYEGRLFDARGERARYVRLCSNGSTSGDVNHYIEAEVFGTPGR